MTCWALRIYLPLCHRPEPGPGNPIQEEKTSTLEVVPPRDEKDEPGAPTDKTEDTEETLVAPIAPIPLIPPEACFIHVNVYLEDPETLALTMRRIYHISVGQMRRVFRDHF